MTTYKIQSGDTLTSIAKKYNTSIDAIAQANGIVNKNLIYAGDTISIPVDSNGSSIVSGSSDLSVGGAYKTGGGSISSESTAKDYIDWQGRRPSEPESRYADDINKLVSDILGMEFSYDPTDDIVYKMVRDENIKNARRAMEDAYGRAAALTGGYANSHAQSVAQGAYNGELSGTVGLIPELYEAAYDRFDNDRNAAMDTIELISDLDEKEFDKYFQIMKQYLSEGEALFDNHLSMTKEEYDRFLDFTELMYKMYK